MGRPRKVAQSAIKIISGAKPTSTIKNAAKDSRQSSKFPLADQLAAMTGSEGLPRARWRAHIVNPQLCDDVLDYLQPELSKYEGCDILDINPGPCLWSTKLNERLKPRVHVLVEAPSSKYHSLIRPLLARKGSNFRSLPLNVNNIKDLPEELVFGKGGLPVPQQRASTEHQINPNLLITGNFSFFPAKGNFTELHNFNRLLGLSHSGMRVHAFGAPKILAWIPSDFTRHFTANSVRDRNKLNLATDKHGEISVVCGGLEQGYYVGMTRDCKIDSASRLATKKRMKAAGYKLPRKRHIEPDREDSEVPNTLIDDRLLSGKPGDHLKKTVHREGKPLRLSEIGPFYWDWPVLNIQIKNFLEAEKTLREAEEANPPLPKAEVVKLRNMYNDSRKITRYFLRVKITMGNLVIAIEALRSYKTELKARGIDFKADDLEDTHRNESHKLKQLQREIELLRSHMDKKKVNPETEALVDDRFIASLKERVLAWDRRPYEPFLTTPEEFYPQNSLSLISFTPKEVDPKIYAGESGTAWWSFVTTLFANPRRSVRAALDAITPGASDYLIPLVPELQDPARGGSVDLDDFPVRCLSSDMIEKLALAWVNSPIREEGDGLLTTGMYVEVYTKLSGRKKRGLEW